MSAFGPIMHMFRKELIEIRRSGLIGLLFVAPLFQVIIFGYVATTDIKNVKTLICDEDNSALSRALSQKFANSEYFSITRFARSPDAIQRSFSANQVRLAVRIPVDFSSNIKKGRKARVQVIVDGSDSNMALVTMNRAIVMVMNFTEYAYAEKLAMMKNLAGELPSVAMEERIWFNPELKSANTMIPGVIGLILMIITLVVTSVSLVREKESGNIEQIVVTPIKPFQIIAGKILPYIFVALIDIVTIVVASLLIFNISFQGSFFLLVFLSLFMILTNLGIGIFISTISSTQQQTILTDFFFLFPNMLLSGFIFPIKNMPEPIQWLTYFVPLRYYMEIIRGVFLKDLSFRELLPQTLALAGFSVVIFTLSVLLFRKKLS